QPSGDHAAERRDEQPEWEDREQEAVRDLGREPGDIVLAHARDEALPDAHCGIPVVRRRCAGLRVPEWPAARRGLSRHPTSLTRSRARTVRYGGSAALHVAHRCCVLRCRPGWPPRPEDRWARGESREAPRFGRRAPPAPNPGGRAAPSM